MFAAENVVPLIKSGKQNDTVTKTLDAVSAKLTTDDLISMNAGGGQGHQPVRHRQEVARQRRHIEELTQLD